MYHICAMSPMPRDVIIQGAAEIDVQSLHAPADPQNGAAALNERADHSRFFSGERTENIASSGQKKGLTGVRRDMVAHDDRDCSGCR